MGKVANGHENKKGSGSPRFEMFLRSAYPFSVGRNTNADPAAPFDLFDEEENKLAPARKYGMIPRF